jgi:glycosyltransferase involved in cell wall biosynthesis
LERKLKEGVLFKNVEIVIVNDGSKDKTLSQIIDYTKKYPMGKNLCIRGVN